MTAAQVCFERLWVVVGADGDRHLNGGTVGFAPKQMSYEVTVEGAQDLRNQLLTRGSCHCGAVRILVPNLPQQVTQCRCSICRRYGALWAYYPLKEIPIVVPADAYVWGRSQIAFHRCSKCGCVIGWLPRGPTPNAASMLASSMDIERAKSRSSSNKMLQCELQSTTASPQGGRH